MKQMSLIITAFVATVLCGCSKFLDVNPKGEVFDADMFTSAQGYEDALYGVYNELAETQNLYGAHIWWVAEACAQNVVSGNSSSDYQFGYLQLGRWYDTGPTSIREGIWSKAYTAINHINNIVEHAQSDGVDSFRHGNLYYGEALALRAMIHFDLLRMFGPPVWASEEIKAQAIPYVEHYTFDVTPFSGYDEAIGKIVADLKHAERLLAEDAELIPAERDNSAPGFTGARITHLNLYAVKALLARVYWYNSDLTNAAIYAQQIIDSGKFGLRPRSAFVQPDNGTLDLNETIFGFYGKKYQQQNAGKYSLSGNISNPFILASDWHSLYSQDAGEISTTDFRLSAWFNDSDQTLRKLVNAIYYEGGSSSYTGNSILGANVLRLPEMYYILAETYLNTPSVGVDYFNAVAVNRGRAPISSADLTLDVIFKERRREFYGEGFTWYEMKRAAMDVVTVRGDIMPGNLASTYMLPIPDAEFEARNNMEI